MIRAGRLLTAAAFGIATASRAPAQVIPFFDQLPMVPLMQVVTASGFLPNCTGQFSVPNYLTSSNDFVPADGYWSSIGLGVAAPTVTTVSDTLPDNTTGMYPRQLFRLYRAERAIIVCYITGSRSFLRTIRQLLACGPKSYRELGRCSHQFPQLPLVFMQTHL
jgi:hypothetical protein